MHYLAVCCHFVLGFSCLLTGFAPTMTAHRTNNSLAASLDGENLSSDTLPLADSAGPSSPASVANSVPQTSSTVSVPVVVAGVYDPALITAIVDVLKASLLAEKGPGSSSSNLRGATSSFWGHSRAIAQLVPVDGDLFSFWRHLSAATGDICTFNHTR